MSQEPAAGYYSRPVLKEPVWKAEIPVYFFLGGLAGAAAGLGFMARLGSNRVLARRALAASALAISACPPLLISDLGRPERFLNMLRVLKPTSPMKSAMRSTSTSAGGGGRLRTLRDRESARHD